MLVIKLKYGPFGPEGVSQCYETYSSVSKVKGKEVKSKRLSWGVGWGQTVCMSGWIKNDKNFTKP